MRVLVVLPTYNEAGNIAAILEAIKAAGPDIDVLVVDDGSPDGTASLAQAAGNRLDGIFILQREQKLGLGSAYRRGFSWGLERGYDVVIEMDADFSHNPADLIRLVETIGSGADLAIGSRYVPGGEIPEWSWHRRALSRWGNIYARRALRIDVEDMTAGFRAYRSSVLAKVPLGEVSADGYGFQIEMVREIARVGGNVVEIPICFSERSEGRSKMSGFIVLEALMSVTRWAVEDRLNLAVRFRRDHGLGSDRHLH